MTKILSPFKIMYYIIHRLIDERQINPVLGSYFYDYKSFARISLPNASKMLPILKNKFCRYLLQ